MEMKTKILYLNDTKKPQSVHVRDFFSEAKVLQPAEGHVFELDIPEGDAVFVKVWEAGTVLLSFTKLYDLE